MLARWSRYVCSITLRPKAPREIQYVTSRLPDYQQRLLARHGAYATRSFGSSKKRKKRRQHQKSEGDAPKTTSSENDERRRRKDRLRLKRLHPAAQWKRILSSTDFWFSDANLSTDEFLRSTLRKHHGWLPLSVLLTFPKFHYWTSDQLLVDAFSSSAAKRFPLLYSRQLCQRPQSIRRSGRQEKLLDAPLEPSSNAVDDASSSSDRVAEHDESNVGDAVVYRDTMFVEHGMHDNDESFADKDDIYDWGSTPDDEDDIRFHEPDVPSALETNQGGHDALNHDADSTTIEPYMDEDCTDDNGAFIDLSRLDGVVDTERDVKYALVTHRRITKELLVSLERGGTEDVDGEEKDDDVETKVEKPKVGSRSSQRYSTERPVHIVKMASQLPALCQKLGASARVFAKNMGGNDGNGQENACAIGMDVEYCTLELDIRNTLPALIQLSSPDPQGPVILIWIDKFPDHGKNMLSDADCGPLIELLSDPSLLKVGVGVTKDASHLARWWGLTKKDKQLIFAGLTEIGDELDNEYSLQKLCYTKLGLHLLKLKDLGVKKKRDKRRKGHRVQMSHWRSKGLTPDMRQYAVNDAACSIDVWKRIHGFLAQGESYNRSKVIDEKEFF